MVDERDENVEFEVELDDEAIDFIADDELDEVFEDSIEHSRLDGLKARGRQALSSVAERGRERIYDAADRGRGRLADAIDDAAGRIDDRLASGSNYLRTHDMDSMRADLTDTIRRYPLLSAGVAIGTGYLLGRVFSDAIPRLGRKRRRNRVGRQLGKAVVSGLGTVVAARMRDSLRRPRSPEIVDD